MAAIDIQGIDHVVLRVADLARSLRFWRDALGCAEERRLDVGLVQLRAGRSLIDLVPLDSELGRRGGRAAEREGRNMEHVALAVAPFDEAAIRARLAGYGIPAGAVETRYGADGFGPSIYLEDPDGNVVELKGPPDRAATKG